MGSIIQNFQNSNVVHCKYFAFSPGKEIKKIFQTQELDRAVEKTAKKFTNRYIYAVDEVSVRFTKQIAQECSQYIRESILSGRFESKVPKLSDVWLKRKKKSRFTQVGMYTGEMVSSIHYFRTNIRSSGEKDHTGWVVGIDKDLVASTLNEATGEVRFDKTKITPAQKLSMLEFGNKSGSTQPKRKNQPPRPIIKLAVNAYLKEIGIDVPFGGKVVKVQKRSKAAIEWMKEFKKQANKFK